MHLADPMRALSEPGSQDAPNVAAAALGASASPDDEAFLIDLIRQGHCPTCGRKSMELKRGQLIAQCSECGEAWTLEMNAAVWGLTNESE
jgi:hypothetical protein